MQGFRRFYRLGLAGALLGALLHAPAARAQEVAPVDAPVDVSVKRPDYSFPLAQYMTEDRPLRLEHANGSYTLSIPLSPRMTVHSARLHLELTNSINLLSERSQLRVLLNDGVVAQVPLSAREPESKVDIRIPAAFFQSGYNKLTFAVAQHYTLQCEDPSAPELWTEINAATSTLGFDAAWKSLSPWLSELAELFDPKLFEAQSLNLVTAPPGPLGEAALQWGALLAQGAALRLQYSAPRIRHRFAEAAPPPPAGGPRVGNFPGLAQSALQDADTLLVGTQAQLGPYLAPALRDSITGSFLGIYPLDSDARRFVLVVSGTSDAEVDLAARAFALLNFPFPDTASMLVSEVSQPQLGDYSARHAVHANHEYSFADLGFQTKTVQGIFNDLKLDLNLPPDLFVREDAELELSLHLAYGASMRRDSVLNVFLNELFQAAVRLEQEGGGIFRNYKLRIPLRSFRPGPNTLKFSINLMPWASGECMHVNTSNLLLTLFDDSLLRVPPALHFTAMPDLQLFARTGFPYLVKPDGSGLFLYVAGDDSQTVASAWMLMARLAQHHALLLDRAQASFSLPGQPRNLIAVGAVPRLASELLAAGPVQLHGPSRFPYPLVTDSRQPEDTRTLWERLIYRLTGLVNQHPLPDPIQHAHQTQSPLPASGLGRYTLALQYEYPAGSRHTATVFAADDSATLYAGLGELVKPEKWAALLQGDVLMWRAGVKEFAWQRAASGYTVGEAGPMSRLQFYFSLYPWLWFMSLLAVVGLFALLTVRMLARFWRKRHAGVTEQPPV